MEENSIELVNATGWELTCDESILSLELAQKYFIIEDVFYDKKTGMSSFESVGQSLRMKNEPLAKYYFRDKK